MKNRFLAFLCALLALATLLCACGKKDETPADTTPADTTGAVVVDPLLRLVENNVANVSVVYPANATDKERDVAESLVDMLNDSFGVSVPMKDDSAAYDAAAVEILVGKTAYTESQETLAELYYSEWIVTVVGNKIVLCAHLDEGMTKANREFYAHVLTSKTADSLSIERTMRYFGQVTGLALKRDTVPTMGKSLSSKDYDVGDNCTMIQYAGVNDSVYASYEATVTAAGYWKISAYDFVTENNKYAQYTNGETLLNVFYSAYNNTARVFAESVTVSRIVSPEVEEYEVTEGYVPKLFQLGVADPVGTGDTGYNGNSYLLLLADGSFVVFDGGYDDTDASSVRYKRQNARRILEIIKAYTPAGKKPTIAAWVISHAHTDHIGAFEAFDKLGYNNQVKVESIIWNNPSYEMFDDLGEDADSMVPKLTEYRNRAQNYVKKGAALYKAHPGQTFHVRNVDLQVVFSPELRADTDIRNYNSASIVVRVVVKDATRSQDLDTVMMTGDMYGETGTILARLYGKAMHCNLVQMPHHGYYKHDNGDFWKNVTANYILWPMSEEKPNKEDYHGHIAAWEQNMATWVKTNLLNNDINSEKCFWAMWDTTVFELPFTGKNFTRTENTVYPE